MNLLSTAFGIHEKALAVRSQRMEVLARNIANADKKLWANQFVEVRVFAGVEHDAIMVPESAVQFGKMGTYLFAVSSSNTATIKIVKTGVRFHDQLQVFGDVTPGERVVALGQFNLYPGASVMDASQTGSPAATHAPVAEAETKK